MWRTWTLVLLMSLSAIETAQANVRRWRESTTVFAYENFQFEPDPWQRRAFDAFDSPDPAMQRISLQACAGPGKTAVEAICGWKFLSCYAEKGEHPKGAAVSVTWDNLKDNLWPEFAKWQQRSPYLSSAFTWTSERIFATAFPETWFLSARSWPKSASPDEQGKTLSGLHGRFILVLADESGAIPVTVLRAADQALSTGPVFGKILQSGNPISLDGMLYAAAGALRHQWFVIRVTGDPDDQEAWVHSPRVGDEPKKWAAEQIATYGRDNPWVKSYILGEFPPQSINAILGVDEVERAMKRHYRPTDFDFAQKRLGVDVARFGDDRTVIFPRQGLAAFRPIVMRQVNTINIAARIARAYAEWKPDLILVDDSGHWGHGTVDSLTTAGLPCMPVIAEAPASSKRYRNLRSEGYLGLADWVKKGGALPFIPELIQELTSPTYTFLGGTFVLEPKDQIKKRLGKSPDLADALALTFAVPDMPRDIADGFNARQMTRHEFEPFAGHDLAESRTKSEFEPW